MRTRGRTLAVLWALGWALLPTPLAAPSPPTATATAERGHALPGVRLERGFLLDGDEEAAWPDDGRLEPGRTLGLIIDWGNVTRPEDPRLIPDVGKESGPPPLRLRRLASADSRAGGRDVIEVLVTSLGPLELPALTLTDGSGAPVARTAPIELGEAVAGDDPGAIPAPARPAASIPPDLGGLLLVTGALLALLLLALWARSRWRRRRRPARPASPPAPPRPPEVVALDALESLLGEGLLERNLLKPFTVRLAEIGKFYFGALAGVGLLEHTTEECAPLLARTGLPDSRIEWFTSWLRSLDMVKFAGDRPVAERLADRAEALRRTVIELSRPADGDDGRSSE